MTIRRFGFAGFCVSLILVLSCALSARPQKPIAAPCCRSALEITGNRSVQLLVIAPNGLETGFDPLVFGGLVDQIPSSNYSLGFVGAVSGAGEGARVERKIEIGTPAAGQYLVQAIGGFGGNFTVKFKATDQSGATTSRKFSGTTWPDRTFVYFVRYSPVPGAKFSVISLTPFSDFSANLDVSGIPPSFRVSATLSLGSGSSRFDPVTQSVSFQLGSYAVTIPPRSFIRNKQGNYNFDGTIEGVTLQARIAPEGGSRFAFKLEVHDIDMSAAINPVRVLLILGDNAGATRVNALSP